jgi:hypothetical protein
MVGENPVSAFPNPTGYQEVAPPGNGCGPVRSKGVNNHLLVPAHDLGPVSGGKHKGCSFFMPDDCGQTLSPESLLNGGTFWL